MELDTNNYINNITTSDYTEKIEQLDNNVNSLLEQFTNLYVITNMYPSNQEYQTSYQNCINNLASVLSKLFTISNDVQVNIDNINKLLFKLDNLITQERNKNKELKKKLGIVENKSNAANEMIHDYKDIYDKRYLRNWSLLLSSIICLVTIRIIYKNQ